MKKFDLLKREARTFCESRGHKLWKFTKSGSVKNNATSTCKICGKFVRALIIENVGTYCGSAMREDCNKTIHPSTETNLSSI
jgi:hypothetical protein